MRCPTCRAGRAGYPADDLSPADGFCATCGRRVRPSRPTPASVPVGASLAGGVVVGSSSVDEHFVRTPAGVTLLVVVGEPTGIEREADLLEQIRGTQAFPRVVDVGVDEACGSYLALATATDALPLRDVGPTMSVSAALGVLRALLEAARAVEEMGFSWEPSRDDVHVRTDGAVRLSRLRVPRKLGQRERLDARAVVEAVGPTFVPAPAVDGPPRAFRMFLPHVIVPGDAGNTIEEVQGELACIEREIDAPPDDGSHVAGVCHPGLRRPRNEDAFAYASGSARGEPWTVLVVCDGVSSSSHAALASRLASETARDFLANLARSGELAENTCAAAVGAAIGAAHAAVCAPRSETAGGDPPGTTIVVGLVWQQRLTVGWIGDSRAYWISDAGSELLTRDHSWANDAVARGEMTEQEAMLSPLGHALTRCLGPLDVRDPDEPPGAERRRVPAVAPDIRGFDLRGPGWVVLCTDGFWNYHRAAEAVASLVRGAGAVASPARLARRLVAEALARGGQDNATVLVYRHP